MNKKTINNQKTIKRLDKSSINLLLIEQKQLNHDKGYHWSTINTKISKNYLNIYVE